MQWEVRWYRELSSLYGWKAFINLNDKLKEVLNMAKDKERICRAHHVAGRGFFPLVYGCDHEDGSCGLFRCKGLYGHQALRLRYMGIDTKGDGCAFQGYRA